MDKTVDWQLSALAELRVASRFRWLHSPGPWLAAFAVLAIVSRIAGLGDEVINWDEDSFMLMAQDVLRGHLPYVTLFDNKPPGIFLWTAAVFKIFGTSVAAVRLTGALWIFATAAFAFAVARRFAPVPMAGAAVAVMLLAGFDPITGGFGSTEWPCAAFLIAAFWLQLKYGVARRATFAAGLCAGLAILFRSNAMVVAGMIGIVYAARLRRPNGIVRNAVWPYAAGVILPSAALALVYAAAGAFRLLWLANVTVPYSYARGQNGFLVTTRQFADAMLDVTLRWPFAMGPLVGLIVLGAWYAIRRRPDAETLKLTAVSASALGSILVCGTFYPHYLVQGLPFAAPWAAMGLRLERRGRLALGLTAAALILVAWQGMAVFAPASHDASRAAEALRPELKSNDRIWAVKYHLVEVYLDRPPVSAAAVHPSNIVRPSIVRPLTAAGYLPPDPFGHVVASLPAYIVTAAGQPVPDYLTDRDGACFARLLQTRYAPWRTFGDVRLYRRSPGAAPYAC